MVQLTPGVDTERFHPGVDGQPVRQRYGLGDRPVIVCVSRLVKRKGQDMLIRALPLIRREVPDAMVLLVGDGPYRRRLEKLARSLRVAEHVVFAGAHPWEDLPPYYAAGSVFCMPCRSRKFGFESEGLGIVYLEASATGLPVVSGNSGGASDAVRNGSTGFVVDSHCPAAISARLEILLVPANCANTGANGREWAVSTWQWRRVLSSLSEALLG